MFIYQMLFTTCHFQLRGNPPEIKDRKRSNIKSIWGRLRSFDPRGFGALEIPTFESRLV